MSSHVNIDTSCSDSSRGILFALAAYLMWGLLPIYWKALSHVPAFETLAHRIFWSMVVMLVWLFGTKRWPEIRGVLGNRSNFRVLTASAMMLGINWFVYIWAVSSDHVVDASLGYYICPLISVALGMVFLRERLNWRQIAALILAIAGVLNQIINYGTFPWVALSLAITFGIYGLIHKQAPIGPMVGLGLEMTVLGPIAGLCILVWAIQGTGAFMTLGFSTDLLFMGTGIITAIPLVIYTVAIKRVQLSTIGFFQYLLPTCQLLLGVFLYKEPFTATHMVTFGFIWSGLIIYSLDSIQIHRKSMARNLPQS